MCLIRGRAVYSITKGMGRSFVRALSLCNSITICRLSLRGTVRARACEAASARKKVLIRHENIVMKHGLFFHVGLYRQYPITHSR